LKLQNLTAEVLCFEMDQHNGHLKQNCGMTMIGLWSPQIWFSSVHPRTRGNKFTGNNPATDCRIWYIGAIWVCGGYAMVEIHLGSIQR